MKRKLSERQEQAIRLVSGEFLGLSVKAAALVMHITPQAVNRLLDRARTACPQLFPLLTKQEADAKGLLAAGWTNEEIADRLQVGLSRVSQIIGAINDKQGSQYERAIPRMVRYHPYLDSQIKEKY